MHTGPSVVDVRRRSEILMTFDGPFTVYGRDADGKTVSILGPISTDYRRLRCCVGDEVRSLEVKCGKNTKWVYTETFRHDPEEVDATPVEVGVQPRVTFEDQVKRYVREELARRVSEEGAETFEEADDFDVPEEEPDFVSQYEMTDMEEEFVPEQPEPEPEGGSPNGEDPPSEDGDPPVAVEPKETGETVAS